MPYCESASNVKMKRRTMKTKNIYRAHIVSVCMYQVQYQSKWEIIDECRSVG